jgi:chemotaxis protein MotB
MTEENEDKHQPIVIKKKKAGHGGHHGGAWKVAYADFVTAMMAFFLVMWIVGLSDEIKQNIAAYFRDPIGFPKGKAMGVLKDGEKPIDTGQGSGAIRRDLGKKKEAEVWNNLKDMSERISRKLEHLDVFERFRDQIEIELTPDGLRIQLIEAEENSSFFARGSAEMSQDGRDILRAISSEIARLPYHVVLEGHTDSKKYADGATYTNWELSADRANTARRVMLSSGMSHDAIMEIRGFADNRPRIKNDPVNPANRRIAIIVLNEYATGDYSDIIVSADDDLQLP